MMAFTPVIAESYSKFVMNQGSDKFTARDVHDYFPFQILPNLQRRGWIKDTGIKKRVKRGNGKWYKIIVFEVTNSGFDAAEYLKRRQEGLD